ncbi:DNA double-strand break repair nuclease NurA [Candidatus Woesearchaeota archaeon]|nr:DNA double-strand break repair nuclease NurA [Candidatus Woesearchaeota archaeon]MBW2978629.1 DNA double-strand break repair nuclease NurA [Candidatus Woesearchaeota archaeon]
MVFNKIIKKLSEKLENKGNSIILSSNNIIPIDSSRFLRISDKEVKGKVCYIDGGNAEIIGAANFSLQLIRTYYSVYSKNKRISNKKHEFYVLVSAKGEENKIKYEVETYNTHFRLEKEFNALDKSLVTGSHKAEPGKIAEVIRKFAEIKLASEAVDELSKGDIIVRDGDLENSFTGEDKYYKQLFEKAQKKEIIVSGLSKTSSILTNTGNSASGALNIISPNCEWYYPATTNIGFAKLHNQSKHVFRLDVNDSEKIGNVLALLKTNSIDPCFLGYPYGLIEADRHARISVKEQKQIQLMFLAKGGNKFREHISSKDAHEILNRIV